MGNRNRRAFSAFLSNSGAATSLEMAVFFAVAAIAVTFAMTPWITDSGEKIAGNSRYGVDRTVTGSVQSGSRNRYLVRRSVLQPSKTSTCLVFADGSRSGDC